MINFKMLEDRKDDFRLQYLTSQPFSHLVIDEFCDATRLLRAYDSIPELDNKSRDYIFANNKFEKSNYGSLSEELAELRSDLASDRFSSFLKYISALDVFVDPKNHGGGLHQGKAKSFLDMHLDFNYHPINKNWYREMNILLYLNKDWRPEYGGSLNIKDLRTNKTAQIEVPFNRVVIQKCAPYSLHGYDVTNFPEGKFRTSIATYAYQVHENLIEDIRTTDWHPKDDAPSYKKIIAKNYNSIVQLKNKILGSGTARNQ